MPIASVFTRSFVRCVPVVVVLCTIHALVGCGGDDPASLHVTWDFPSGDCASNNVETVVVSWGRQGGPLAEVTFACADGEGVLGNISDGTYTFDAVGLDANGVARAESYGATSTLSGGGGGHFPIDITLHPQSVDLVVSWSLGGAGGCPGSVILPYFITLYRPPTMSGARPTIVVDSLQESCTTRQATFTGVAPGDYVVELDSRAVTPSIRGTVPVTIEAGVDAMVSIDL